MFQTNNQLSSQPLIGLFPDPFVTSSILKRELNPGPILKQTQKIQQICKQQLIVFLSTQHLVHFDGTPLADPILDDFPS